MTTARSGECYEIRGRKASALPDECHEAYEERAGILEFMAGLPRAMAERLARQMVEAEFRGRAS